jgi:hypothetical protein
MKKERQIGIRVGVPAFFALELEDVYKHTEGAHRALAFPDFVGLLVGMGLEQYRKGNAPAPDAGEYSATDDILSPAFLPRTHLSPGRHPEDIEEPPEGEPLHLFDMDRKNLHSLFREFDEAMEHEDKPGSKVIGPEDWE